MSSDNPHGMDALRAAEEALKQGRFHEVDHHLNHAAAHGAQPRDVADLGRRLRTAQAGREMRVQSSVRFGFFIALVGYVVLSARQPMAWTPPVWLAGAFLVVPSVAGFFVGRRHAGERTRIHAFSDGARSCVWAMACYSSFNLLILADHLQKEVSQMFDEYLAAFITVVVFSLIAGAVAGCVSALASLGKRRANTA